MNEVFKLKKEFLFKTNIYEINSISIEQNFDIKDSKIDGEFIISGNYRIHEISINKEDFMFKVPFKHEISNNIDLNSINIDINDFNYKFISPDELDVDIEYILTGKELLNEFENEESLEDFLSNDNFDVVDLRKEEENIEVPILKENKKEYENNTEMQYKESTATIDQNMILNSINDQDEYILYHVHTVTINDTLESIMKKYNVTLNTLKEYNDFENLELNMKILIPNEEI